MFNVIKQFDRRRVVKRIGQHARDTRQYLELDVTLRVYSRINSHSSNLISPNSSELRPLDRRRERSKPVIAGGKVSASFLRTSFLSRDTTGGDFARLEIKDTYTFRGERYLSFYLSVCPPLD